MNYNQVLDLYRQHYITFLVKQEIVWGKRMEQFANEIQSLILEYSREGAIIKKAELRRKVKLATLALANDLQKHLKDSIVKSALLSAKGIIKAHEVHLRGGKNE